MTPHSPLSGHLNPYQPTPNPPTFITTLFTLYKHMALHSRTPNTTTFTRPHTPTAVMPTVIYSRWYDHSSCTCFLRNTRHNQLTLIIRTDNGTSRRVITIQILSKGYMVYQCSHPHAVYSDSSVMPCYLKFTWFHNIVPHNLCNRVIFFSLRLPDK